MHNLTRFQVVYRVFVDAHDEEDALDQVEATGELDPYTPDEIVIEGAGDECMDDDCEVEVDVGEDEF